MGYFVGFEVFAAIWVRHVFIPVVTERVREWLLGSGVCCEGLLFVAFEMEI